MTGFQMAQIRVFTSKLFVGDTFDHFLVKEAEIINFNRFSIDGHLRKEFYTAEELSLIHIYWGLVWRC